MKNYYYCVDIGGTTVKAGIIDEDNNILFTTKTNTIVSEDPHYLTKIILNLIEKLEITSNMKISHSSGLGIGAPGLIDATTGTIKFSGNLKLKEYPLKEMVEQHVNVPVKVANDADLATLAELKFGAGKKYNSFILLTLGTGIGSGLVINGELYGKNAPYSGEIGHMKVSDRNVRCSCGDYNCFEALASTRALSRMTKTAMKNNPSSKMWSKYNLSTVNGKTVFEFKDKDETAKTVFETFVKNLGTGIVSLVNVFMPEAIILGGAISNEKEALTKPVEDFVNDRIYARNVGFKIKIETAKATAHAGILGGKCLFD